MLRVAAYSEVQTRFERVDARVGNSRGELYMKGAYVNFCVQKRGYNFKANLLNFSLRPTSLTRPTNSYDWDTFLGKASSGLHRGRQGSANHSGQRVYCNAFASRMPLSRTAISSPLMHVGSRSAGTVVYLLLSHLQHRNACSCSSTWFDSFHLN